MISQILRKKYPRNFIFTKPNQNINQKLNKTIKNSKIILPKTKIDSIPWKHTQSNILFIHIPHNTYIH